MDRDDAEEIVADYLGIPADLILPTDLDDLEAAIRAVQDANQPLNLTDS